MISDEKILRQLEEFISILACIDGAANARLKKKEIRIRRIEMKRFRNFMLAATGLAVFALVLALTNTIPAGAGNTKGAAPALMRDIDNPARQPFQTMAHTTLTPAMAAILDKVATVPAGKRLVIEFVSAAAD